MPTSRATIVLLALTGAAACRADGRTAPPAARGLPAAAISLAPPDSAIPGGALGAAIRHGHALLADTRDSLPANVVARLRCFSCHLDDGRRANSSPFVGVMARYPAYNARAGHILTIEDRVNGCFLRSMNGTPLADDSPQMRAIVAYFAWVSRGVPIGSKVNGQGLARLTPLAGDSARGHALFSTTCVRCHGPDGAGTNLAPPLWGSASFNIGAGMARIRTAASFIRNNMPFDRPGSLTDQQAFDLAAYVTTRPRPDLPGKENDWPNGDAPPDVAYPTRAGSHASRAMESHP